MYILISVSMSFSGRHPLSRYVTTSLIKNVETILIQQLASYLGANHRDNVTNYMSCGDCYGMFDGNDQVRAHAHVNVGGTRACACVDKY